MAFPGLVPPWGGGMELRRGIPSATPEPDEGRGPWNPAADSGRILIGAREGDALAGAWGSTDFCQHPASNKMRLGVQRVPSGDDIL